MVVFPIIATVLAFGCCLAVLRDQLRRARPAGVVWTIAFAIFGAAALAETLGSIGGWTPFLARAYYVLGATLVVGWLALGELYLLLPRSWADRIAGAVVALSALAVALVTRAEVVGSVADDGWEALERGTALTALTMLFNIGGTLVLVGGLLYSAVVFRRKGIMRNRMLGCLLIAGGTLSVASGGTLTRLGRHEYLYIAMSVGIALIFAGYLRTRKPDAPPARVIAGERTPARAAQNP